MNDQEIKEIIFRLLIKIAPDTNPEGLAMDDNIRETLGIDSFDFLQFIVGLDEELDIQTPEDDYGELTTLNTMIAYIKKVT